jgi:FlaA1/EpsC-like NDP-sugar epimerase
MKHEIIENKWHAKFLYWPRKLKQSLMILSDAVAIYFAFYVSHVLRFNNLYPESFATRPFWEVIVLIFLGVYVFSYLGLYRSVVRFLDHKLVLSVTKGSIILAISLLVLDNFFAAAYSRSIPIIFGLVLLIYITFSRLAVRFYYSWLMNKSHNIKNVLIYGAGSAGHQLASSLLDSSGSIVRGFIDEDKKLIGSLISGIEVFGEHSVAHLIEKYKISDIYLAIPSLNRSKRKQIISDLSQYGIHVQTIPSLQQLISGESIDNIKELSIEDILGRDVVGQNENLINKISNNQNILVSGAGGTIGSEISKQLLQNNAKKIILLENSEFALYRINNDLIRISKELNISSTEIIPILGNAADQNDMENIFANYDIDTIFHAAAYKHVPIVESNPFTGVSNNIFSTLTLAKLSNKYSVSRFVLISTDKAVRPTNIMGASKRISELILQNLASRKSSKTIFSMVRFGNVLDSSGSVVPLFREQIKSGGPVSVTHKSITRFFMMISEASSLVIQAGAMAKGGEVFLLDMGKAVKILDLARNMIRLSGLQIKDQENPDGDIEIVFSGLRPGEKLYEELLVSAKSKSTEHPMIYSASENFYDNKQTQNFLDELKNAILNKNETQLKLTLSKYVEGYKNIEHEKKDKLSNSV